MHVAVAVVVAMHDERHTAHDVREPDDRVHAHAIIYSSTSMWRSRGDKNNSCHACNVRVENSD
eukprot:CAMPEP_0202696300 /NCGR_PEP_ID=MMETSP1385-20130828/9589_1 /ASSEMBLY_ACC=CAM_ASM_000861 /TAXON_ID=933848 /ORGANISM="Elphidium margaritaceum" /LENGTH=62 /DNA_ID=CAMNT_0049352429 /DNA_START=45 /DNA_END=230 /DNA_ORIENTATION=+